MACFLFLPLNCFAVTKFISVRLLANTSVKTQLVNLSKPNGAEIAKKVALVLRKAEIESTLTKSGIVLPKRLFFLA